MIWAFPPKNAYSQHFYHFAMNDVSWWKVGQAQVSGGTLRYPQWLERKIHKISCFFLSMHSFKVKMAHKRQCNEVYTTVLGDVKTKREILNGEKSK